MNITAKELSGVHLLSKVTIPFEGQQITGTLTNAIHDANVITERPICSKENSYLLGAQWVYVQIAGNFEDSETISTRLHPDTPIVIQEGE